MTVGQAPLVALVTGASRGVGRGVAHGLGEAGAAVYVTGRTTKGTPAVVPLGGTLPQTAAEVTKLGGRGVPLQCDHRDDSQVSSVVDEIMAREERIDLLVNNAWAGYEGYATDAHLPPGAPFYDKPLSFWDDNLDGLRWSYVATRLVAPVMIARGTGLIVNISVTPLPPGNVAYNIAKTATDQLTRELHQQLSHHGLSVVTVYPGLVRTESILLNAQYFDMTTAQAPVFTGRAIAALAADPGVAQRSGLAFHVEELAADYGIIDEPV